MKKLIIALLFLPILTSAQVFDTNQIIDPVTEGVVYSDGQSFSNLTARATSTLGLPTFSDLSNYVLTSNFGNLFFNFFSATTTDALTEGVTNLYDKIVTITGGTGISISGTYPNFTITNTGGSGGGLATSTPWTTGQLVEVVDNNTVRGTSSPTVTSITATNASFTNATSTNLGVSNIEAIGSGGILFKSNNGTNIADFGGGGGSGVGFFGGVNIDGATRLATSLTGILRATAGVVSTGLVNLASEVTGILPVSNGGTGSTTLTGILKGNGTSAIQTAIGGTDYEFPLTFNAPLQRSVNTISLDTSTLSTSKWATSSDPTAIIPAGASKVGIGTSTPVSTLSVDGDVTFQGDNFATTTIGAKNHYLSIKSLPLVGTSSTVYLPSLKGVGTSEFLGDIEVLPILSGLAVIEDSNNDATNPGFVFAERNVLTTDRTFTFEYATTTNTLKAFHGTSTSPAKFIFSNVDDNILNEKMLVGIGTTSPWANLSVDGSVAFQGDDFATTTIGDKNNFLTLGKRVLDGFLGTLEFPSISFTSTGNPLSERFGAINGGVSIIGTESSIPVLAFLSDDFANSGNGAIVEFATSTNVLTISGSNVSILDDTDTEVFYFDEVTGNIGLGTTTPEYGLTLVGKDYFNINTKTYDGFDYTGGFLTGALEDAPFLGNLFTSNLAVATSTDYSGTGTTTVGVTGIAQGFGGVFLGENSGVFGLKQNSGFTFGTLGSSLGVGGLSNNSYRAGVEGIAAFSSTTMNNIGLHGLGSGGANNYGVKGYTSGNTGNKYGGFFSAQGANGNNFGIFASSSQGVNNYAGWFGAGNVVIENILSIGTTTDFSKTLNVQGNAKIVTDGATNSRLEVNHFTDSGLATLNLPLISGYGNIDLFGEIRGVGVRDSLFVFEGETGDPNLSFTSIDFASTFNSGDITYSTSTQQFILNRSVVIADENDSKITFFDENFSTSSTITLNQTDNWLTLVTNRFNVLSDLFLAKEFPVFLLSNVAGSITGGMTLNTVNGVLSFVQAAGYSFDAPISGFFDTSDATVRENVYPAFSYSTSTAWTGTTTIPLGVAYIAEQWAGVKCFTDTGTLNVRFNDGTNNTETLVASTTVGSFTLTTNNTFATSSKRYVEVGTPASSPKSVSCTVNKVLNP